MTENKVREAATKFFFSGLSTKRGGIRVKAGALRKNTSLKLEKWPEWPGN